MTRGEQIAFACDKIGKEAAVELAKHIDAVIEEYARELDPPVCRLQFPDGSVPGNSREAAEGWKRWYDRMSAWNDTVFKEATEAVRLNGGVGEGGHAVDRLVWLNAQLQKLRSRDQKLRAALTRAGFGVMETSGDWSVHCTTDAAKEAERAEGRLIGKNLELVEGIQHALALMDGIKTSHPEIPDEGWRELDEVRNHLIGVIVADDA